MCNGGVWIKLKKKYSEKCFEWITVKGGSLHVAQVGSNVRKCGKRNLELWYCG